MVKNEYGQSGLWTLRNEQMELTDFLHAGINSGEIKVDSMMYWWAWSKMIMAF